MTLHCLREYPSPWLAEALERFERQFDYPLGESSRFRITHGRDYLPFFQAMGRAQLYVIERQGKVLGTLAHVERFLEIGADPSTRRLVHYLCDLKVAPAAQGSRVLGLLVREARRAIAESVSHACYSVVMTGTGRVPTDYTGRLDIPSFLKVAEIVVLRLSCASSVPLTVQREESLGNSSAVRLIGGNTALRSLLPPMELKVADASGVLEDTRRGKRLWAGDGREMRNAHVSNLRFYSPESAARLLGLALDLGQASGFEAIFTAVPKPVFEKMKGCLAAFQWSDAPAAIYGYELPFGYEWWIDSTEI